MAELGFYQLAMTLCVLWVALLLTPGPDFVMMLRATVNYGYRHALVTGAGITAALSLYIAAVIIGIDVLFENKFVFQAIKYAGAGYLLYLGVSALRSKVSTIVVQNCRLSQPIAQSFRQGFICNILNPKAPILIGSIFSQIIGASTPTPFKIIFGVEMVLLNLLVWGLFPRVIRIPAMNRLLLHNARMTNSALGVALIALGAAAFV